MYIIIDNSSMTPIYEQIAEKIKDEILTKKIKEGDALPSVRSLATEIKVSALTVKKAYDYLEKTGYIVTVHGKGSFVAKTNTNMALEEQQKEIENLFEKVVKIASANNISKKELKEMLELIMEELL